MLGLVSSAMISFRANSTAITLDYSRSVQQVYLATAKALLANSHNLSVLSHVEDHPFRRTPNLPSWVPDYSVCLDPYPLRYRMRGRWMASGHTPWRMNVTRMDSGLLDGQDIIWATSTKLLSSQTSHTKRIKVEEMHAGLFDTR